MSKSRLIFTFITINLIAAALGLNELAISNKGNTNLGRTSLIQSQTFNNIDVGNNITIEQATIIQIYEFQEDNICDKISSSDTLSISSNECQSIRTSSVAWLGLGVFSILLLFIIFLLLLRIECRKLCSKSFVLLFIIFISYNILAQNNTNYNTIYSNETNMYRFIIIIIFICINIMDIINCITNSIKI